MKKINARYLFLFVLMFTGTFMFCQTANKQVKPTPPSDATSGYTYDFDKTIKLIMDRVTNPGEFNKDVQVFLSAADFPKYKTGQVIDAELRNKIRIWIEKNPDMIINTLKHRNDIVKPF